ncbi:exodeoxyribonuclease 7 small subunit [Lactobacillus nasalidis]|uniref:Exodeoxyribonuclease 7 small subunit n=1 Tax=Lactobacillus nasalidis TaxID=2797258 RepID=A0ABQ3W7P9_9LACO|nr:exodeoxyribonuclease VII small subunit [Lactobacillus nasalidis]GHV97799.1 exodeoxyribonuclease 7 small subunit [Lactobacillus nasalidis]GHV99868.1 exodeoxyribonuclease 7 small subunit [Lactobacillus nasalidis]GHW01662.1 exodeoxyribonuclease 7 small subunit [Lactobacillus nasalidis]
MTEKNNFEEQLKELQEIVTQLENGQLSLEESLNQFQTGVKLSRQLKQELTQAENTVAKLIETDGSEKVLDPTDASAPKE